MDWHLRYTQQAAWTRELRQYAYRKFKFDRLNRILEVGCGTGAILTELGSITPAKAHGLDISAPNLRDAALHAPGSLLTRGDAHDLPYADSSFDAVVCHFTLLWLKDPNLALTQMTRVTRSQGVVLLLAEPDYGGRIDYPFELEPLGRAQIESLSRQGADPEIGRKLKGLLHDIGLTQVETGVLSGQWSTPPSRQERQIERQVLESDLEWIGLDLSELLAQNEQAWDSSRRVLFVPTFYGWGVKP